MGLPKTTKFTLQRRKVVHRILQERGDAAVVTGIGNAVHDVASANDDPKNMYLAYNEGRGGYARGSYKSKPEVVRIAERVDGQARKYGAQLRQCEDLL